MHLKQEMERMWLRAQQLNNSRACPSHRPPENEGEVGGIQALRWIFCPKQTQKEQGEDVPCESGSKAQLRPEQKAARGLSA